MYAPAARLLDAGRFAFSTGGGGSVYLFFSIVYAIK
jgi:hypothetical protein